MFEELGVKVYGVSLDDVAAMGAFHKAQELNFQLLSDPDGGVARKFGVLAKGARFSSRVTFVLDEKGLVRHIERSVNVKTHGENLLDLIVELQE